jgi:hypothetical protein
MIVLFVAILALAWPTKRLGRAAGVALLCAYPAFLALVLF